MDEIAGNDMDLMALLTRLFASVLVCAPTGEVRYCIGRDLLIPNVLVDDSLLALRPVIREALTGNATDVTIAIGPYPHARVRCVAFEDGFVLGVEELLHPFAGQRRARLTNTEFEFIVRHMRQGLWRLDAHGVIETANDYLVHWLETTHEELVGSSADRWIVSRDGDGERFEAEFQTDSGLRRRALVDRNDLASPRGRVRGSVDIITDITAEHALRTRLVEEVQRMARLARTDPLTGLANRMEFEEELRRLTSGSEPYALILADVDDFKLINDTHGHAAGDEALISIAQRLRSCVRDSDLVSRLGGDEFAILLSASREKTEEVVDRIKARVSGQGAVRVSVGWSHSDEQEDDVARSADERMYEEKRRRKTQFD